MTKVVTKKLLPIMGTLALVVVLAVSFVPSPVYAQTADRDLPDVAVTVNTEFDVAMTASAYGGFGQIIETLPTGFAYISVTGLDDFQVDVVGQVVTFTLLGETAFTYTVMAPATATTGIFAGILKDSDLVEYAIGGDTDVEVVTDAVGAAANRDLPDAPVTVSTEFDVAITASAYGGFGQIIETLPAGFTYTAVTGLDDFQVDVVGQVVTFTLIGETAFTYTVMAPATATTGIFAGILKDSDLNEYVVGGETTVEVIVGVGAAANRDLPDVPATVNTEFDVGITALDYGGLGQIIETLPTGFTYTGVTGLDDFQVDVVDQVVTFTLIGETAFTYTVMAPATATTGIFAGILKDSDNVDHVIGGDTQVEVTTPAPEPVELEFSGSLVKGERETLLTPDIPAGVIDLNIELTATADIDLELYDGDTFVIGWKAEIDSKGTTTGTYEGDTFTYSGWDGGDEDITADGPLGRAYTLKVYGYKAGDYIVDVSYTVPVGVDVTPPVITITAPDATVGVPATITVSATDPSDVAYIWFGVWTAGASPDWYQVLIMAQGPGGEVSVTFTPPSEFAGTYTIMAWAGDTVGNWTPDAAPETATWVVTE